MAIVLRTPEAFPAPDPVSEALGAQRQGEET
jgi:hypothetical protein